MGVRRSAAIAGLVLGFGFLLRGGPSCYAFRWFGPAGFGSQEPAYKSPTKTSITVTAKPEKPRWIPTTGRPTPKAQAGPKNKSENCTILPYKGAPRFNLMSPFPPLGGQDIRGGMICKFRINPRLPVFTFRFVAKDNNPWGEIEISEGDSRKIIQTIPNRSDPITESTFPFRILVPRDANFDGYNDLPLLLHIGATGNCIYDFYLYDPAAHQFIYNSFLSGLVTPEIDSGNQQVHTSYHLSGGDWWESTYEYREGHYVEIQRVVSKWDRKNNTTTEKVYELSHGKMQLIKSTTSPF
jgi:hypothetical protein